MSNLSQKKVILPGGREILLSNEPQSWWTRDGGTGYVDPHLLAPSLDQPRGYMDAVELAELTESVRERGVRQSIDVAPLSHTPWGRVAPEHKSRPFIIVSGHRRQASALNAPVGAVPIKVTIYENDVDFFFDASLLNGPRAGLTYIEEGREIVRLRAKGMTEGKIAGGLGKSKAYVQGRVNLTKLHPAIQELLRPDLPPRRQLPVTVAAGLGSVAAPTMDELEEAHALFKGDIRSVRDSRLVPKMALDDAGTEELRSVLRRFELQKILLAVILHRGLKASRATEFILERKLQLEASHGNLGKKTDRFEPRKRKEILERLVAEVTKSTVIDWTPNEFRRIFENSESDEMEHFRRSFHEGATILSDIEALLKKIRDESVKGSNVTKLIKRS